MTIELSFDGKTRRWVETSGAGQTKETLIQLAKTYLTELEAARRAELAAAERAHASARDPDARVATAATYVLKGGRSRAILDELKKVYRPEPNLWPWSEATAL